MQDRTVTPLSPKVVRLDPGEADALLRAAKVLRRVESTTLASLDLATRPLSPMTFLLDQCVHTADTLEQIALLLDAEPEADPDRELTAEERAMIDRAWGQQARLPVRSECRCPCHTTGAMHVAACCRPDPRAAA